LIAAFATADANPQNDYKLILRWRRDGNGNTVKWGPLSTITLKRGHVFVLGSQSNNYPERYIFDGQGARNLFAVVADPGYKPTLTLSGITVQNGWGKFGSIYPNGGGLFANGADDIQIYYCKFLNNKSNQNGSGISTSNTRNVYILHTVVDGNKSDQTYETDLIGCGGWTSGGGGIAITNSAGSTTVSIHHSTISNNLACRGGGLELWGNINLYMYQNTVSGNIAVRRGGGIFWHQGSGSATLRFNTIAYNRASTNAGTNESRYGGGIAFWQYTGSVKTDGNIIAQNKIATVPNPQVLPYIGRDCYSDGSTLTGAYLTNWIGRVDNCGILGSAGTWGIGTEASPKDPKIDTELLERGSGESFPLPVLTPFEDSPVRGNFFNQNYNRCDYHDQRELIRTTYYNNCDIGSVEYGAGLP
jgi:hypothetical protein